MKNQKKATQAARAAWRIALSEGRVLHFPTFTRMVSYPTVSAREIAEREAFKAGYACELGPAMKLSLNLPAALVAALKTRAAADSRSLSNLIALLLARRSVADQYRTRVEELLVELRPLVGVSDVMAEYKTALIARIDTVLDAYEGGSDHHGHAAEA